MFTVGIRRAIDPSGNVPVDFSRSKVDTSTVDQARLAAEPRTATEPRITDFLKYSVLFLLVVE